MSGTQAFQTEILKSDALSNAHTHPLYLTGVEVNGGENFSKQFFTKLLDPLTDRSDYTLDQLLAQVDKTYASLERVNVFSKVEPSLHVDYLKTLPDKKSYNKEKPILTKVVFDVEANELSNGQVALAFNNEDNLTVDLGYLNNNFNHNAELVNIGVNYRPYKPSEHLASGIKVESSLTNPAFKFVLDLHNLHDNNQAWQKTSAMATGGSMGVSYQNPEKTLSVFNGLALTKRAVYDFGDDASDSLRASAGDFLKSSILSRITYSKLATIGHLPVSGFKASASNELASDQEQEVSSDKQSAFVKTTGSLDLYKSVFGNAITAHVFGQLGSIYSAQGASGVHLSDRFYMGGFESFKGFARNSINEEGGLQYYKAGATIFSEIPWAIRPITAKSANPLRLYATGSVGSVANNILKDQGVASTGVGLRYFNEWVNLDVGYYVSKRMSGDSYGVRDGFSLEVSLGGVGSTK